MRVSSVSAVYPVSRFSKINHSQPKLQNLQHNEVSFQGKATWKGLIGAVIGAAIAGPLGAALLGAASAGYGAIEDDLDEEKKNGTDWSKMPEIA